MKAVVTRVTEASVTIEGRVNGKIGTGFLVLLGIAPEDTEADAIRLADRVCGVRVFPALPSRMWRFLSMKNL